MYSTGSGWIVPPRQGRPRQVPNLDHVEQVMRRFAHDYPGAVVLGGWSTFLRAAVAKSHDIDVIVDHPTLDKLRANHDLSASQHVSGRKFELKIDGVGVDVYPVYQSKLGQKLKVPVEVLIDRTDQVDGVRVLTPEAQFVAKMAALLDRPDSLAGEKDRREMVALLKANDTPKLETSVDLLWHAGWSRDRQQSLWQQTFDFLLETEGLSARDKTMLKLKRVQAVTLTRGRDREGQEMER
jgi:hypothetical protein